MPEPTPSLYETLIRDARRERRDVPVRASASIVPWRLEGDTLRVYWVRRSRRLAFMGGWWAFAGGGVSRRDAGVPVAGTPAGSTADTYTPAAPDLDAAAMAEAGLGADLAPEVVACALRELYEETGLLPLRGPAPNPERLHDGRRRLLAKQVDFATLLREWGVEADASDLVFAGRWLTPPFVPRRFDNRFFLMQWPGERPAPTILDGELDRGEWIEPAAALERWRAGEALAAPPILHVLKVLAEDGPSQAGLARLRDPREADLGPMRRIEFRPGIVMLPLETPTLPPATHTNAFLVGHRQAALIDPATPFPEEQERLFAALDAAIDQGLWLSQVWLSHHHPDHVGAVAAVCERYDIPAHAHAETARRLQDRGLEVAGDLGDGHFISLGGDPPFQVRIYHTPGHAPGHLCFYVEAQRTLLAGDLVSNLSTIVIDPPEGDMDDYLASLERMIELSPRVMFPSHGPGTLAAEAKLRAVVDHRLERERQVLAAVRGGKTTPESMVDEVYPDVPAHVHPIAARQIQAHLDRLRRLGEI